MVFLCPICKVENRQNAKFCRRCGRARAELELAKENSGSNTAGPPTIKEVAVPTAVVVATFEEEEILEPADETAPQCSACWAKLRLTDKFCFCCGEPQPERSVSHLKTCVHCQSLLPAAANFCFACGQEVSSAGRRNVRSPVELFSDENSEFFPRFEA